MDIFGAILIGILIVVGIPIAWTIAFLCACIWFLSNLPWYLFEWREEIQNLDTEYQNQEKSLLESTQKFGINEIPPIPLSIKGQLAFRYTHLKDLVKLGLVDGFQNLDDLNETLMEIREKVISTNEARERLNNMQQATIAKGFANCFDKYNFMKSVFG